MVAKHLLVFRPFSYLRSQHQVTILHVLRSHASSLCTPVSFVSFGITSLHSNCGLPIFQCPLTSIFHVLITISSSIFLSTVYILTISVTLLQCSHLHLSHTCYFFCRDLFNPSIPIIYVNILVSVLSSESCSAILNDQVSILWYPNPVGQNRSSHRSDYCLTCCHIGYKTSNSIYVILAL